MGRKKMTDGNPYELKYLTRNDLSKILKENTEIIVRNINKIMRDNRVSQDELATAIHSEQCHISYILRERPDNCVTFAPNKGLTINVLGRIAAALHTSIPDLAK